MPKKRLTPEQWIEIDRRVRSGESMRSLGLEYQVDEGTIRKRINKEYAPKVLEVAKIVAHSTQVKKEADKALSTLDYPMQIRARSLAESLIEMSNSLAKSAELSAKTSLKLSGLANLHASKIDESKPDPDLLRMVHGLTETANKAAYQPLELIKANKEMMQNSQETIDTPSIDPTKLSSEVRQQLLAARDATDRS